MAPWQAHPCEGQSVPPPDHPCGERPCRDRCDRECDTPCGDEACEEECNVATDWLHMFEPRRRLTFRGQYLPWWTKSQNLPTLVTDGTNALFSGNDGNPSIHSGARLELGYWFNDCHDAGLDITYTFLGNTAGTFRRDTNQVAVLDIPFLDVAPGSPGPRNYQIHDNGPALPGSVAIRTAQELNAVDVLSRCLIGEQGNRRFDFLFGYRYGRFSEDLSISDRSYLLGSPIDRTDRFDARNEFNGCVLGFVSSTRYCRWSFDVLTKIGLGNTHSRVNVTGENNTVAPVGGLFALPTNSGTVVRDNFSAVPEIGLTLGYDVTCRLKATVGYTFLYWSGVMRPGDQIDTTINSTQIPPGTLNGAALPQVKSVVSDFWAQGLSIGLDYCY
jgi:hypothetical protein